jgi:hypothetical protein
MQLVFAHLLDRQLLLQIASNVKFQVVLVAIVRLFVANAHLDIFQTEWEDVFIAIS